MFKVPLAAALAAAAMPAFAFDTSPFNPAPLDNRTTQSASVGAKTAAAQALAQSAVPPGTKLTPGTTTTVTTPSMTVTTGSGQNCQQNIGGVTSSGRMGGAAIDNTQVNTAILICGH